MLFISVRLDYCSFMCVLAKLTRLQLDLNASARLLRGTREQKHAQIWAALHWVPVQITTDFKWLFFVVGILRISSDTIREYNFNN